MKKPILLLFIVICLSINLEVIAQRGHEISFQAGYIKNIKDRVHEYYESKSIKHVFRLDQDFSAQVYQLGWNYPLNGYLEVGMFFNNAVDATNIIIEDESGAFNVETGASLRPDTLFAGINQFKSRFTEVGFHVQVNLIRTSRVKAYMKLGISYSVLENIHHRKNSFEIVNENLKHDFLSNFQITEKFFTSGYAFGVSYDLKRGIKIMILEFHGKNVPNDINLLSATNSVQILTGISYQFYRGK